MGTNSSFRYNFKIDCLMEKGTRTKTVLNFTASLRLSIKLLPAWETNFRLTICLFGTI
jgi:hypothetical protein